MSTGVADSCPFRQELVDQEMTKVRLLIIAMVGVAASSSSSRNLIIVIN